MSDMVLILWGVLFCVIIPRYLLASVNLRAHLPLPAAVDCVSRYSLLHHSVCGDHIILCRGLSLPKKR